MAGFRLAIESGAAGFECDLRLCGRTVMVFHDETLDRSTSRTGRLRDLDSDALAGVALADGEPIPTLRELLDLLAWTRRSLLVNLELKEPATAIPVLSAIAARVRRLERHRFILSTFDPSILYHCAGIRPEIERALLLGEDLTDAELDRVLERIPALALGAVHLHEATLSEERVVRVQRAGLRVRAYTLNEVPQWQRARQLGLSGIITDDPQGAVACFAASGAGG